MSTPDQTSLPEHSRALLEACRQRAGMAETPYIYRVLAAHPDLFRRLMESGLGRFPEALLAPADRELLTLRTLRNCGGEYEWTHHVRQAPDRGLSPELVGWARDGAPAGGGRPALLLNVADELHHRQSLTEVTRHRAVEEFGDAELLEMIVLVAYMRVFALIGNVAELPLEPAMRERVDGPWPIAVREVRAR